MSQPDSARGRIQGDVDGPLRTGNCVPHLTGVLENHFLMENSLVRHRQDTYGLILQCANDALVLPVGKLRSLIEGTPTRGDLGGQKKTGCFIPSFGRHGVVIATSC